MSHREARVIGFVMAILLIGMIFMMNRNTEAVRTSNELKREDIRNAEKQEYERVLLGCSTEGVRGSDDPWLRELCDEELPFLRERAR
jgi:hypothetical protein